jgi:hypothetical protein
MAVSQPELTWEALHSLISQNYEQLLVPKSDQVIPHKTKPYHSLRFIIARELVPQKYVEFLAAWAAHLYRPTVMAMLVVTVGLAHWWLYASYRPIAGTHGHVSMVLMAMLLSVLIHEMGHASAVARFGGRPGSIGIGLYILLPVFYADVSQIWTFTRHQRAVVDLGGIFFQQICFIPFATAAVIMHSPSFRATCISIDLMTIIAANPAFRFDGYWLLVDWLGMPHLHKEASAHLKRLIRELFCFRLATLGPKQHHLDRFQATVFVLYGAVGNLLVAGTIAISLRWIVSTVTSLYQQLPLLVIYTGRALHSHQWLRAGDMAITMAFTGASGLTLLIALFVRGKQISGAIGVHKVMISLRKLFTPRHKLSTP